MNYVADINHSIYKILYNEIASKLSSFFNILRFFTSDFNRPYNFGFNFGIIDNIIALEQCKHIQTFCWLKDVIGYQPNSYLIVHFHFLIERISNLQGRNA